MSSAYSIILVSPPQPAKALLHSSINAKLYI